MVGVGGSRIQAWLPCSRMPLVAGRSVICGEPGVTSSSQVPPGGCSITAGGPVLGQRREHLLTQVFGPLQRVEDLTGARPGPSRVACRSGRGVGPVRGAASAVVS